MTSATEPTPMPAPETTGGGHRHAHAPALVGLFEGYGGLSHGVLDALGGGHVAAVAEIEPAMMRLLAHHYPDTPNLGDVAAINWGEWAGQVDVIVGGFPCQDVSLAGVGRGLRAGTRSGLWSEFARAIDETRPRLVVAENVRGLLSAPAGDPVEHGDDEGDGVNLPPGVQLRALGAVLGDLASLGYDAEWGGVRAADVGAPHPRFRVFVVAFPVEQGEPVPGAGVPLASWSPGRAVWERADGQVDLFADAADAVADAFVDTWPANGCMRSGVAYRLPEPARGVPLQTLPTPLTSDEYNPSHAELAGNRDGYTPQLRAIVGLLPTVDEMLPTPKASDGEFATPSTTGRDHAHATHLSTRVVYDVPAGANPALMPTPQAVDGTGGRLSSPGHATTLPGEMRDLAMHADPPLLPTPDADAGERGAGQPPELRRAGGHSVALSDVAEHDLTTPANPWGKYAAAVHRWEHYTRTAPAPTAPNRNGKPQLSPLFTEWMMGLDAGLVTDPALGLTRSEQLKACGNGVVPQQATHAVRVLLGRLARHPLA